MKRRILSAAVAALLLFVALPATAEDMATASLPTGTIMVSPTTVYDGTWSGASVVGTLNAGTGVIVLEERGDWVQIFARADRIAGWVAPGSVQINHSSPIFPGIVISQNVSLRESPSTGAKRLASIPNGSIFDLLDEQNGWYRVSYWDGKAIAPMEGWVRVDFVVRNPSFITTTNATYVYATPNRSAKKVGELTSGTQLVVIGEYNDFWVVNLRSASGFIYKKDIDENLVSGGNG